MEQQFGPVRFIPGKRSGRYPYSHSLYIEADTKVLIDASSDDKRLREIRDGPGVDAVWLTHWHEDHFKYLHLFDDRELWISEKDAAPLAGLERFFRRIRYEPRGARSLDTDHGAGVSLQAPETSPNV